MLRTRMDGANNAVGQEASPEPLFGTDAIFGADPHLMVASAGSWPLTIAPAAYETRDFLCP